MNIQKKGEIFERRVGHLFTLLGYRVELDALVAGRQVDLLLEDRSGPLMRTYIVECKDHARPINTRQYDAFAGRLRVARQELGPKVRGLMVASVGFVKEVKAQSERDDIELLTISELETSVIDFRPYVAGLIGELDRDDDLAHFVEPRARRETLDLDEPFLALFEEWLRDPLRNHLTLLGDYGTGKTTALKRLGLDLARRYQHEAIETGSRARVPVYIDLKDYTHAISLKQIILDFLDHHGIRAASYAAFEHVLREGQVILLLDGFDEMASRGNYKVTLRNFRELNKNIAGRTKIVLSCRTHYFTTEREVRRFHGQPGDAGFLPRSYTDLYRDIAARPNFLIVHLQEFGHDQVEAYIRRRCGERWRDVLAFIEETYDLGELCRRPVLLDMIVASERQLAHRGGTVSPGLLYQVYTDFWLSNNDWSTVIDITAKSELLEALARRLANEPVDGLSYRKIPEMIESWRPGIDSPSAIEIDRDLRTATFLVRDGDGQYRFSHRSFQEFFTTRALLSDALDDQPGSWAGGPFATEVYRFARDLLPERPAEIAHLVRWLADPALDPWVRTNAAKCLGAVTGDMPLAADVSQALIAALTDDPAVEVRQSAASSLGGRRERGVERALVDAARRDGDRFVRANCLTSLAKARTPAAREFLLGVLSGEEGEVATDNRLLLPIVLAAAESGEPEIVAACLAQAPRNTRKRSAKDLAVACLDLIMARPSEGGHAWAELVLDETQSPRLIARAFGGLPIDRRRARVDRILDFTRDLIERQPTHVHLAELIAAMRDVGDPRVEALLVDLLTVAVSADVVSATLDVLVAEYPDHLHDHVGSWIGPGRPHAVRLLIAERLARHDPGGSFELLVGLLDRRQRPATRIHCLQLLDELHPSRFADVLEELWAEEKVPGVKKHAAEMLRRRDRQRARTLLRAGLSDRRTGTRSTACAILGSETDAEVTGDLLDVLRADSSKWVRSQALRSLCAPGREVDRSAILHATAEEPEAEVLALRDELLGRVA
ncbi:MAG: HEAT repeat domain-containing protein [Acidobacteriota bacterium]